MHPPNYTEFAIAALFGVKALTKKRMTAIIC
jgi:hypothetical protein